MDKKSIRDEVKSRRKVLSKDYILEYSNSLWDYLYTMKEYKNSEVVMSYMSFNNEIDTEKLNRGIIKDGKMLLLPRVEADGTMSAVPFSGKFKISKFGVSEPVGEAYNGRIDLVIVPGLGFDKFGSRVGYGKGYYDRFFTIHNEPIKIAPAFEFQIFDVVETHENDVKINGLLTKNNYVITINY